MDGKLGLDPRVHVGMGPELKSGPIHFTVNIMLGLGRGGHEFSNLCQTGLTRKAWQKVMYEWGPIGCPPLSLLPVFSHHPAMSWPDES